MKGTVKKVMSDMFTVNRMTSPGWSQSAGAKVMLKSWLFLDRAIKKSDGFHLTMQYNLGMRREEEFWICNVWYTAGKMSIEFWSAFCVCACERTHLCVCTHARRDEGVTDYGNYSCNPLQLLGGKAIRLQIPLKKQSMWLLVLLLRHFWRETSIHCDR